ncbi:MAG: ABC transporter permease [Candidatus Roizmanbacteria bacterium]
MSLNKIKAIALQEYFIILRTLETMVDIFVFPLVSIALFGFLSNYLIGNVKSDIGHGMLMGMILWQVMYIIQYSVTVGSLWNIWSKNLTNIFVSPISSLEYLIAHSLSGLVKAGIILALSHIICVWLFQTSIFSVGVINLMLFTINLAVFAIALGVSILGMIFRYGTRIQSLAWGFLGVLQPLTASFYPVSALPQPLQYISYTLSPTYIFEGMRSALQNPSIIQWNYIIPAFFMNASFFIISIVFFNHMFKKSKESGQFARNEG